MAKCMRFLGCGFLFRNRFVLAINSWKSNLGNLLKYRDVAFNKFTLFGFSVKSVKRKSSQQLSILPVVFSFSLFKASSNEKLETKFDHKSEIVDLIKKGKKSLANGEHFGKAEMFYLRGLHLAIEDKNIASVTYMQDLLANLALANNQLEKSEILFRKVLQNLISGGKQQNDTAILEISLKLASIYARMGKKELAVNGYEWCAETCRKNVEEMKKNKIKSSAKEYVNAKALLGMILDSYGRYLHDEQNNKAALEATLEALHLSKELFGEKDIRTLVLYNDLSSIKLELGHYDEALELVQKALNISEAVPGLASPYDKAVFYANLSYLYVKKGKLEDAESYFKRAMAEASKTDDLQLKAHVNDLLKTFPKSAE